MFPDFRLQNTLQDEPIEDITKASKQKDTTTRKRIRNPETWQRNIRKKQRQSGQEYIDTKGKIHLAKRVKTGCEPTCPHMCFHNFNENDREKINAEFYSLSDARKKQFYDAYTSRENSKRKRTNKVESRRKYSFKYFFLRISDKLQVCKHFFCSTLNISQRRIYHFYKNRTKKGGAVAPTS